MVTGKVANDALTSLLSDSLADMGVKDNKKSKPMSTMRKAASGPVPSSSYSPTDYAPVLGSQDQSFSKVQSTPSVAPTPPLDSSVGAGGDVSSLFDMLGDLSSSVPAPPAASAASGASAAPVMVDMTGGVTKTMSGSDKNDSYDHLDDFFGSITSQRSSQDKQESPTAAAADEDDVMLKVKVKSNASSPFAPQDDFEPLDLSPSTQGDDIFGTGPSTPHSYSNLGGDFDILNANPYDARGQEEDVPYEPTEQGEEVKREQSAEQAQDTTGGLDIFASEPAASEGSKAEGGFTSLEDLMGGGGGGEGGEGGDKVASESPAVEPVGSVEDGLDIFATEPASGGSVAKTAEKKDQGFTSLEDLMGATGGASSAPSTSAPAGADAQPANTTIDDIFGTTQQPSVCTSEGGDMWKAPRAAFGAPSTSAEEIDPNEPEIRKQLREKRIRGVQMRMAQALEEARERDTIEALEKAERSELAQYMGPKLDAWAKGKNDNIRALLSTLQMVLWEGSGWKEVSMMDLMNPAQVKKQYRKAMIIMHPDKVKQKGGTTEQVYIADYLFDLTNSAWGHFQSTEM